jgi:hypothetical protein
MKAKNHALNFLSPVDSRCSIINFGKKFIDLALSDKEIAEKFSIIQKKMGDGKIILQEPHFELFEKIKTKQGIPNIPILPDWLSPVITVAYLRAKSAIENKHSRINLFDEKDYGKLLDEVIALTEKIEPDFLGELLIETVLTANRDKRFSKKLNQGAKEYNELVQQLYGGNFETSQDILSLASNSNSGGCTACRSSGGRTFCKPVSCWIIVIIIVIVIITK